MIRRILPATFSLILLSVVALFSTLSFDTSPAQAQTSGDPLAGMNIYFSESLGEASRFDRSDAGISRYAALLSSYGANMFTLEWRKGIPEDADLIVLAGPTSDLSPEQVARLWTYLRTGGKLFLIADELDARGGANRAIPAERGLFELLWADMGLRLRDDVIATQGEFRPLEVIETDRDGNVTNQFTVDAPFLNFDILTGNVDADHPITDGLNLVTDEDSSAINSLFFSGARSVEINGAVQDFELTPLVFTQDSSTYGESNFATFVQNGVSEYNVGDDTPFSELIVAAALDNPRTGARIVLIGDVDALRNGGGMETSPSYTGAFVFPNNARFFARATGWLLGAEVEDLTFTAPAPTATPTTTPTPTPMPEPTAEGES